MRVFVFDLETTGLPPRPSDYRRYYDPFTETHRYDSARVVEMAYVIYESDTMIQSSSWLVQPDGFLIENSHIHGITQDVAERNGVTFPDLIKLLRNTMDHCDRIVAHNLDFDMNVLAAELVRYNARDLAENLFAKEKLCTMKYARSKLCLPKWPRLNDLYNKYFGDQVWKQSHRALDDVSKTADCYFALMK